MLARMITKRKKHWLLTYFIFFNTGSFSSCPYGCWMSLLSSAALKVEYLECLESADLIAWFNCIVLSESQMTKEEWKS